MDFSDVTQNPDQGNFTGLQSQKTYEQQKKEGFQKGMEGAGVLGGSFLNSALLGAPELATKLASPDLYNKWKQLQGENPEAAIGGDIAGYLPGLPEKAIVGGLGKLAGRTLEKGAIEGAEKGGSKLAENLLKAYETPKGIIQAGAKGAFQAGANAVPRNLIDYTATGNEEYLKDIPSQLLFGGAIGAGGRLIQKGFEKAAPLLLSTNLKAAGVTNNTVYNYMAGGGRLPKNITKDMFTGAQKDISQGMERLGIKNIEDIGDDLAGVKPELKLYNEASNNIPVINNSNYINPVTGKETSGIIDTYLNSPEYKKAVSTYGMKTVDDAISNQMTELSNADDMISRRNFLKKQSMYPAPGSAPTSEQNAYRFVANDLGKVYDDLIDQTGKDLFPDISKFNELKKDYRLVTSLIGGKKWHMESFIPEAGSATASRNFVMDLLEKRGAGAAGGAGLGLAVNQDMLDNPDKSGEAWRNIALSTLGGAAINKYLPKIANKAVNLADRAGTAGAGLIGKNKTLQEILNNPARIAGGLIKPETAGDMRNSQNINPQTSSVSVQNLQNDPNLQGIDPTKLSPDPNSPWKSQEAGANQNPIEQAKNHYWTDNQTLYNNMIGNLQNKYFEMGGPQKGVDFGLFVQAVKEKTNNFQPDLVAHLIYDNPEQQQRLRDSYKIYKKLTERGNQIDLALQNTMGNQALNLLGDVTRNIPGIQNTPLSKTANQAAERQNAFNTLVDLAEELSMKPGVPAKPGMKALLEREIREALSGGGTQEQRKKRIIQKFETMGLDTKILKDLGAEL